MAKKLQEKLKAGRNTASTTPKEVPIVEEHIFQMEAVEKGNPIPSFQKPRIISQEDLIAFALAEVEIEIILPPIKDNQYSITKTSEEIHSQENIQHFCAPVIHPTTGELITSYKILSNDPSKVYDEVITSRDPDAVWVFFLWSIVNDDVGVCYHTIIWNEEYLVWVNYHKCICCCLICSLIPMG